MPRAEYTPEQVIAALESTAGVVSAAALKLGVSGQTVRNYMARHPEIAEARKEIIESNLDLCETKLLTQIRDGNLTATIFYLKTQGKHRGYIEGREIGGRNGAPIKVETPTLDPSKLSTEALRELRQAMLAAHADPG